VRIGVLVRGKADRGGAKEGKKKQWKQENSGKGSQRLGDDGKLHAWFAKVEPIPYHRGGNSRDRGQIKDG